ncbi:MAG: DUF2283 domain-containing protein [bacterium]|nr:DUF2283 domain-containing protein [bacterium]
MKISYDPEADAMYIRLKQSKSHKTVEVNEYTLLDYDKEGNLIGIEILFVKEHMPSLLGKVSVKNLSIA